MIRPRLITADVNLEHTAEGMSAGFLHHKDASLRFPYPVRTETPVWLMVKGR